MRQVIAIHACIVKMGVHHSDRHIKQQLTVDGFQSEEEEMQVEQMLVTVFPVAIAVSLVNNLSKCFSDRWKDIKLAAVPADDLIKPIQVITMLVVCISVFVFWLDGGFAYLPVIAESTGKTNLLMWLLIRCRIIIRKTEEADSFHPFLR